ISSLDQVTQDRPASVVVALGGLSATDVREAWLHVRGPDGGWRRMPMTVSDGGSGARAVVDFPQSMLDEQGNATFYVSVLGATGEEYFTELRDAGPPHRRPRASRAIVLPQPSAAAEPPAAAASAPSTSEPPKSEVAPAPESHPAPPATPPVSQPTTP